MATKQATPTVEIHPKTLLLCVFTPDNKIGNPTYYYEEFLNLVNTLGMPYDEVLQIKLRAVDNNHFFTKGKMAEVTAFCQEHEIEEIIISELLTPIQERNLEDVLGCTVFDRERLILEIFKNSAKTSEGKIQVEMAEIEFMRTRLIGKGKEYAQQAGFIGGRGPGETIKEEIKRHFAEKYRQSKKKLDTLQKAREVQRKQRTQRNVPVISIIGYTNAGKSSLLNRLTKSNVLAENKLFATLDITTREFFINSKTTYLLSDTVGFISNLPANLIEAFKSTLEELQYAALLLHVIDISNPSWKQQIAIVNETLAELNVKGKPIIYVFNKIDKLPPEALTSIQAELSDYNPHVLIHTQSKEGVVKLIDLIKSIDL